ncbi:MAG TPA: adenosylcobinamide amidohydrolase [Methanoregulaceae archaeon]|nr:adenosylcobinamide amidohydrolase [Methanoregulaceae archaeon]
MRYFLRNSTLFVRGNFRAASTGIHGTIGNISTILNKTVPEEWDHAQPERLLELAVQGEGLPEESFGLLTAVDMHNLCVFQYDFITIFITAGVSNPGKPGPNTINIIVYSAEGMSDAALLECILIATEAKVMALQSMDYTFSGTTTDAVVASCEGELTHIYGGVLTEVGKRVYETVLFGVPEAIQRHEGHIKRAHASFFIFSRYGGDHWVEWVQEECPYYPCHFEGQSCDFCYCPFYPCRDESLGHWVNSSHNNRKVWNCAGCTLLHDPEIARYLNLNPEAGLQELKSRKKMDK